MASHSRYKVLIFFWLGISSLMVYSEEYTSLVDGKWFEERQQVWGNGVNAMPPYTGALNNGDIINILHNVSLEHDLDGKNGFILNIVNGAKLTVNGNFEAGNNIVINVIGSGVLIINGNFEANNGASVHIEGNVNVSGNMHFHNNSSINLEGGDLQVGGDLCGHFKGNDSGLYIYGDEDSSIDFGTICSGGGGSVDIDGPLPIELLSFTYQIKNQHIILNWITASETNNDFFTIERSSDMQGWKALGNLPGAGNSNQRLSYQFSDIMPQEGISYYRLKQTDFDGKYEYFNPLVVKYNLVDQKDFKVRKIHEQWEITLPDGEQWQVFVHALNGIIIYSGKAIGSFDFPAPKQPVVIKMFNNRDHISRVIL